MCPRKKQRLGSPLSIPSWQYGHRNVCYKNSNSYSSSAKLVKNCHRAFEDPVGVRSVLLCLVSVCFECHSHFNTLLSSIAWISETVERSSFPSLLRLGFPLSYLYRNKICSSLETPFVFWRVLSGIFPLALYGMPAKPHLPIPKISWSAALLRCSRFIATC